MRACRWAFFTENLVIIFSQKVASTGTNSGHQAPGLWCKFFLLISISYNKSFTQIKVSLSNKNISKKNSYYTLAHPFWFQLFDSNFGHNFWTKK